MKSIFEKALGEKEFAKLHPKIRERFGFHSEEGIASIGRGVMEEVRYAKWAALPLAVGASRHIMFPEGGRQIPFSIENYAYRDALGRETLTINRTFRFERSLRRFDATMVYSEERERIVDYLGNKQHLAVDLDAWAAPNGGIQIRSGEQRFYEGPLGFRFPATLTGCADVCEWYDDDDACYRISVSVRNPLLGRIFAYKGAFQVETARVGKVGMPLQAAPLRLERRE
ncbi:DUF4166 domain-containing protein [Cohnella hashimotonis]|uniref:DUF4166 domain-containing protein n=1 Tax=Cohnella hashimotonis TaxID=2826895 RepID=A0ABT6TK19_9BACL|nr:DUF4166 domain-containing protein [Cohnella hashimotonis]MDI4647175.1 DUF4166 domain-containing protein [Cohnella hashimotonis]